MVEIYKKSQGAVARWTAIISLGALAAFGAYELLVAVTDREVGLRIDAWIVRVVGLRTGLGARGWGILISGGVFLACMALIALVTNIPRFADYLIASELELRKVSWPTKGELKRQTIVVIFTLLLFSLVLFLADALFSWGFHRIYFSS